MPGTSTASTARGCASPETARRVASEPMIRLSNATLADLPESIARPRYDRAALTPGIVHIGLGNFHRAPPVLVPAPPAPARSRPRLGNRRCGGSPLRRGATREAPGAGLPVDADRARPRRQVGGGGGRDDRLRAGGGGTRRSHPTDERSRNPHRRPDGDRRRLLPPSGNEGLRRDASRHPARRRPPESPVQPRSARWWRR